MDKTKKKNASGWRFRSFTETDRSSLIGLWQDCGLTTPWNDPDADIDLCQATEGAALLIAEAGDVLVGSVMVGQDGHRGWVYFLAAADSHRGQGLGRALMQEAEAWLTKRKVPKVQLMVRESNLAATNFYACLGYHRNSCWIMQRWLTERQSPPVPGNEDGRLPVTITFLEMTERPAGGRSPLPRGHQVALMRATKPNVAFYRYLYDTVGGPWLWWERRVLEDEALRAIIQDPQTEIYVLYIDGVPAGFGELDRRPGPDINLDFMGLLPEFVGQGLGAYLLSSVIDIAWSHEPRTLTINTNSLDHPRALALYQRWGFHPVGQKEVTFIDPRRTGVIMP